MCDFIMLEKKNNAGTFLFLTSGQIINTILI